MEIGSVSSGINAAVSANAQAQARVRQSEQDQQAQQMQKGLQAQSGQSVDEKESAVQASTEAEKNRPTVNTNGQVVGRHINTTA